MKQTIVEENQEVIKEGDQGNELYIVYSGLLNCFKKNVQSGEQIYLRDYKKNDLFGELALMYNAPRAATIIAKEKSELYSLDRETFNNIVKVAVVNTRERHEEFLNKIEFLADLSATEKAKICDCLISEKFKKGDYIIKQGEPGARFYLIEDGKAQALKKDDKGKEEVVFEYKTNDYFGELALLGKEPRQASVKVTSDTMQVVSMDIESFNRLLGSVKSRLQKNISKYHKYLIK